MSKMRTVIVDDEPIARRLLRKTLKNNDRVDIVGENDNGFDVIETVQKLRPDLLLLDIQMPGMTGFEVMDRLEEELVPAVIFVTAYDQFAITAIRKNAVDYVLKPIDEVELSDAIERAAHRIGDQHESELTESSAAATTTNSQQDLRYFIAKQDRYRIPIQWSNVDWIEAAQNYVKAHIGDRQVLIRSTLSAIESQLEEQGFARAHRSIVVNIAKIKWFVAVGHGDFEIELQDGSRIPLSRTYRQNIERIVGNIG